MAPCIEVNTELPFCYVALRLYRKARDWAFAVASCDPVDGTAGFVGNLQEVGLGYTVFEIERGFWTIDVQLNLAHCFAGSCPYAMGYSESAFPYGATHFCRGVGNPHNAVNRAMPIGEDAHTSRPPKRLYLGL